MASKLTYSPSETYGEAITNKDVAIEDNFATLKIDDSERTLTNIAQTDGGNYTIRYAISDVKNVYTGTGIDPVFWNPVKAGKSLLVKVRHTGVQSDLSGNSFHMPIEVGMTFKFPVNSVNEEDLVYVAQELMNAVFRPNSPSGGSYDMTSNLRKLMRGAFPNV
jgi:hypothetical protein